MSLGINNPFILKERERPEIEEKDQSAYQKFFAKELSKRGVKSPSELAPRIKKHSMIILMQNWKADDNEIRLTDSVTDSSVLWQSNLQGTMFLK